MLDINLGTQVARSRKNLPNRPTRPFLKPAFPTCPIFIAVFFDEGDEPPNQASRVRLTEPLAVGVNHSAVSQTGRQSSLDEFRDRIHIATDKSPTL